MTSNPIITETAIRTAAIAKGYAEVSVAPQTVNRQSAPDAGDWFVLSVKRHDDDDWKMLGRRRTRGELIELLRGNRISGS